MEDVVVYMVGAAILFFIFCVVFTLLDLQHGTALISRLDALLPGPLDR